METMMANQNKDDDKGAKQEIADLRNEVAELKMGTQLAGLAQENADLKAQIGDRSMPGATPVGTPVSLAASPARVATAGNMGNVGGPAGNLKV